MKFYRLDEMKGGWFVGNFEPTCLRTDAFEVASKKYKAGDGESRHVHRIATEITVIASGRVVMNGQTFAAGDIVLLEPGEAADFQVLEDALTVVVKMPSAIGDKYLV
jgi:mannose-6-phosphate isomerase-like protein (cupin superfamily)